MTTPSDLDELERIAKQATPGPWTKEVSVYSNGTLDAHWAVRTVEKQPDRPWSPRFITFMTGTLRSDLRIHDIKGAKYCRECETWHLGWSREIGVDVRVDAKADADATHIATFDPPTVLSLIQALRQASDTIGRLKEALEPFARMAWLIDSKFYAGPKDDQDVYHSGGAWREPDGSVGTLRLGQFRRARSILQDLASQYSGGENGE